MRYSDLAGCVCIHAYRMQSASDLPDLVGAPVRCHVRRVCTTAFVLKCGRFPVVSVKVQGSAGIFFFFFPGFSAVQYLRRCGWTASVFFTFLLLQRKRAQRQPGLTVDPHLVNRFPSFLPVIQFPSWLCCVFHLNSLLLSQTLMRRSISHTSLLTETRRFL